MRFWKFGNRSRLQEAPQRAGRRLEIIPPDAAQAAKVSSNNYLAGYAKRVTSQHGEDGVLAEILRRMGIAKGWCVEFGAWDGKLHSNTWDLVHTHGWSAVLIEPFLPAYEALVKNWQGREDVYCLNTPVTSTGSGSLDALLSTTPIPAGFDLMIVDIDGNDFYVWRACENYAPKVVMIEFNPFIPPDIQFVKEEHVEERCSASLRSVTELAKSKGYELICVLSDGNAIFVRSEYFPLFAIDDNRPEAMFKCTVETKIFQGYDGNLFLAGHRTINWRWMVEPSGRIGNVEMTDADIQVLPAGLRVFRPRLSYRNAFLDEQAGRLDRARVPANRLLAHRRNITSECGEDGILEHLFARLGINRGYCVEVGANDGKALSNTWSLVNDRKWTGLLIEKDTIAVRQLETLYAGRSDVHGVQAEVTSAGESSLAMLLGRANAPKAPDFLCIDVEGNDIHLWASLTGFRPKVVMVDFNPSIPNDVLFVQEDSEQVHHGASLRAFVQLAHDKGYELAAVTSWNAIFVEREAFPRVGLTSNRLEEMYYPVFEMRVFQSMNLYLTVVGCNRLVRHDYVFDPEQLQPLPPNIRAVPYYTTKADEQKNALGLFRQLEGAESMS